VVNVPTSLANIDAAWLTAALAEAGETSPPVSALDYQPIAGNVGALGEVGVFTVSYDGDTDLPRQFLGKCPLDNDSARLYNSIMRYYGRESGFYRDLAGGVPMRVPRCWVNVNEDERYVLLLEYFADATPGDVLEGTTFDNMLRLIGDMASLHGRYWMDRKVRDLPWMFQFTEPSLIMGFDVVGSTWPMALAEAPGLVPADLAALIEGPYIRDVPAAQWIEAYNDRPWTLVHGDYELENVLFLPDGTPAVVDWQGIMVGFPAMDLGFTLAVSGSPETVERETELLDHYRRELTAAGGPQWSADELLDDLAWSMLFFAAGQTIPFVQDYSSMGPQGERLHRRMVASWRGCVDAAVRWETAARVTPPA
jgi:hypothetical protein